MTKKMENIVKTYEERLNTQVFLFEKDIIDYEKAKTDIRKEEEMFEEMVSSMFHYHLISEKDFSSTIHVGSELRFKYFDKLLEIKFNKNA